MYCSLQTWGPATWTTLHCMASSYPNRANEDLRKKMRSFLLTFADLLPCRMCGAHFREQVAKMTDDTLAGRDAFLKWTVDVHNDINRAAGKTEVPVEKVPAILNQRKKECDSNGCSPALIVFLIVLIILICFMAIKLWQRTG
jgi:hypothetical protein